MMSATPRITPMTMPAMEPPSKADDSNGCSSAMFTSDEAVDKSVEEVDEDEVVVDVVERRVVDDVDDERVVDDVEDARVVDDNEVVGRGTPVKSLWYQSTGEHLLS
jgi:hypothetical protein